MSKTGERLIDKEHDGMRRARGLTLLANEGYTPAECVHKIWKPKWVSLRMELPNREFLPFALEHRCPVSMGIEVIWRRENTYDSGDAAVISVHAVSIHNSNQQELQVICRGFD